MAVPGEQESFKSQSFSKPSKSTSTPTRTGTNFAMAQGKGSMPTKEATRRVFFDNRPDISDDRLERRQKQFDELRAFKNDPTKTKAVNIVDPVTGKVTGTVTGLTQAATAGGKTVTQREQELAFKYGPTFSEIASDVTYAGGEVLGALGERAMSGGLGFLGAIKEVANYARDKANKGYDKLNPVQQEIFDNPNKYPFASNISSIDAVNSSKNLALEAQRDVLGLGALEASAADATNTSAVGGGGLSSFVNEPIGTFGGSTMGPRVAVRDIQKEQLDAMDIGYVESGQFRKDLQKSGILSVDDPSTQEPLPDSTEIPGYNATI